MASNSNKRNRKKRRAEPQDEPEFQVAPMIDVLLVLTLFFMSITSTELLKKDKNLELPDAASAKKDSDKKGQVVVNISWNHNNQTAGFSIDGRNFADATSLVPYLASKVASDPRTYALLRADKDVQYSNVSDVMSSCASAGIAKVSFATITSGAKAHPGAAAPAPTP